MGNSRLSWLEKRRNKEEVVSKELLLKLYQKLFGKVRRWAGVRAKNPPVGVTEICTKMGKYAGYTSALYVWLTNKITLHGSPLFDLRQEHCEGAQKSSPKAYKILLVRTNKLLKKLIDCPIFKINYHHSLLR